MTIDVKELIEGLPEDTTLDNAYGAVVAKAMIAVVQRLDKQNRLLEQLIGAIKCR